MTVTNLSSGFLYLYDWMPLIESLSGDEFKALFLAIVARQRENKPFGDLPGYLPRVFAEMIEPTIKRRLSGQVGGKKSRETLSEWATPQGTPQGTPRPSIAEHSVAHDSSSLSRPFSAEDEARFARFWESYPKKKRKDRAKMVFRSLSVDDELLEQMLSAVKQQKTSEQWNREGGRFIPYPDTWLRGGQWEDEEVKLYSSSEENFDTEEFFTAALIRSYGYDPRTEDGKNAAFS